MTRRAVALAPSDPMIGHPMVGDPFFDDDGPGGLLTRRACQYASAILKQRGLLPLDASHLPAVWFVRGPLSRLMRAQIFRERNNP